MFGTRVFCQVLAQSVALGGAKVVGGAGKVRRNVGMIREIWRNFEMLRYVWRNFEMLRKIWRNFGMIHKVWRNLVMVRLCGASVGRAREFLHNFVAYFMKSLSIFWRIHDKI